MKQRVVFVNEPPPIGGPQDPRSVWMERLALLVEKPGQWAEVYSGTQSACHNAAQMLRNRQYHVPPGGWDFSVRSFRRGHLAFRRDQYAVAVLYARYLGPDEEAFTDYQAYHQDVNAVWDQWGRRLCPVCERTALTPPQGGGSYPHQCEPCADEAAKSIDAPHGKRSTYTKKGCRCRECREASRVAQYEYQREYRARRKAEDAEWRRKWLAGEDVA